MTASENKMETRIESMSDCRRKYPTAAGRAGLLLAISLVCSTAWAGGGMEKAFPLVPERVIVDSSLPRHSAPRPPDYSLFLTDGVRTPSGEWASAETNQPHWIELQFTKPVTIQTVAIFWNVEGETTWTSQRYGLQSWDGQRYQDILIVDSNPVSAMTVHNFTPVTTTKLRIYQPAGGGPEKRTNIMWVAEVEAYDSLKPKADFVGAADMKMQEEITVGVYDFKDSASDHPQEIVRALVGLGKRTIRMENLDDRELKECPVVVLAGGRYLPNTPLLMDYVYNGGAALFLYNSCGRASDPLFPDVWRFKGMGTTNFVVKDKDHTVTKGLPNNFGLACSSHVYMDAGKLGTVLLADEDGNAVVIAGKVGKGKVLAMGNFPADGKMSADRSHGPHSLVGGELALLKNAIEWLAEGATRTTEWRQSAIATARESKGEQFTDVTDVCGMANAGLSKTVAMGDVDNDGDLDIFATVMSGAGNLFYRNDGKWNFTEMAAAAGVLLPHSGVGSFFGDVDGDGNLDLFVSSESSRSGLRNMLYLGDGQGKFRDVTDRSGPGLSRSPASAMGIWADIDHDGDLDLYLIAYPEPNRLYRNRGDGTFEDATSAFGLSGLGDKRDGGGEFNDVSGSFGDLDGDGYQDLMFFDKTRFRIYRNMGGQRFEDVTAKTGVRDIAGLGSSAGGCLGVALGDIDNDGDLDMYVAKRATWNTDRGPGGFFVHNDAGRYLLLNDGKMHFKDITEAAGFKAPEAPGRAYGPIFVDVNNDGYLDLFQAQGWGGESLLFRNNGNLTFSDVTGTGGIAGFNVHGYCFGDLDRDGDLDLYTTTWIDAGEFKLHRNNQNDRSYLIVRVNGRKPNTSAIGAKIWVYEEKKGRLRGYREIIGGGGAMYTCPTLEQHFGLPSGGTYSVKVFFPVSGKTVSRSNVSAGRTIVIKEP